MNYEIEKAIKEHANEKELYLATCVIVQDEGLATDLWFLYANEEDARRWLDLCREYHKALLNSLRMSAENWCFPTATNQDLLSLTRSERSNNARELISSFFFLT